MRSNAGSCADYGHEVSVAVKTSTAMTAVLAANPLARRSSIDMRFLHVTFLIRPDRKASLDGIVLPLGHGEEALLMDDVIYLYCPNGYRNTKINNTLYERNMGARATTRNWNTVTALENMAREGAEPQ